MVEVGKTVFYALRIALVLRVLLFQPFTIPSGVDGAHPAGGRLHHRVEIQLRLLQTLDPAEPAAVQRPHLLPSAESRRRDRVQAAARHQDGLHQGRLVGLPGDHIQVKHGTVFVNDKPIGQMPQGQTTIDLGGFTPRPMSCAKACRAGGPT
ncbi:MAG: S26 family signal peptidase [Caulobacteraceae bacterium]